MKTAVLWLLLAPEACSWSESRDYGTIVNAQNQAALAEARLNAAKHLDWSPETETPTTEKVRSYLTLCNKEQAARQAEKRRWQLPEPKTDFGTRPFEIKLYQKHLEEWTRTKETANEKVAELNKKLRQAVIAKDKERAAEIRKTIGDIKKALMISVSAEPFRLANTKYPPADAAPGDIIRSDRHIVKVMRVGEDYCTVRIEDRSLPMTIRIVGVKPQGVQPDWEVVFRNAFEVVSNKAGALVVRPVKITERAAE